MTVSESGVSVKIAAKDGGSVYSASFVGAGWQKKVREFAGDIKQPGEYAMMLKSAGSEDRVIEFTV
jgi:hypothetical protein